MKRSTFLLTIGGISLVILSLLTVLGLRLSLDVPLQETSSWESGAGTLRFTPAEGEVQNKAVEPGDRFSLEFGEVQKVELSGAWKVTIVPGTRAEGTFTTPHKTPFFLDVEQKRDTLRVKLTDRPGSSGWSGADAVLELTVPAVRSLILSGSYRLELKNLKAAELEIVLSGAGSLSGTGGAESLQLTTSGAVDVDFSQFSCKRAEVTGSGAGTMHLSVPRGELRGQLSGLVNLTVSGNPQEVNVQTSGPSTVKKD